MNIKNRLILVLMCLMLSSVSMASGVAVGFSPSGTAQQVVLSAIDGAKKSIDMATYSFTSKPISLALINAKKRGVAVRVISDKKANSGKYTAVTYLANQGVSVRLNGRHAIHHNKFMIVDGVSVETGSFNYSSAADKKNAENVVYLKDMPDVANRYSREFNRLWAESEEKSPNY